MKNKESGEEVMNKKKKEKEKLGTKKI